MTRIQKIITSIITIVVAFGIVLVPASAQEEPTTVTVGVVGDSTDGIWELVQQNLDETGENIQIELVTFTDGVYAHAAQNDGELDLTAFQHNAFLNQEVEEKGYDLVAIGDTFISPMNIFSETVDSIDELQEGDTVLVPNNITNLGRALIVLDRAGLITVDEAAGYTPDLQDIVENPLNLNIEEVAPELILSTLPDAAAGITNSDFVLDYGWDPIEDAIFNLEFDPEDEAFQPYVNIIVARGEDAENETYQSIVEAYQQDNVEDYILEEFNNAMVPVWE